MAWKGSKLQESLYFQFVTPDYKHIEAETKWLPFSKRQLHMNLKFVTKGPVNNIQALVRIMAWRRSGGKPLSEPMLA